MECRLVNRAAVAKDGRTSFGFVLDLLYLAFSRRLRVPALHALFPLSALHIHSIISNRGSGVLHIPLAYSFSSATEFFFAKVSGP